MSIRTGLHAARAHEKARPSWNRRRALKERNAVIAPSPTTKRTTLRPVPKPTPRPIVGGRAAYRLAQAQGRAFEDIAADLDAAEVLGVGRLVDHRRDPLILEIVRLFSAIRHDLGTSRASRALATRGEACALEAIRLDRIKDEHDADAERYVGASLAAGRAVIAVHEELLTGRV